MLALGRKVQEKRVWIGISLRPKQFANGIGKVIHRCKPTQRVVQVRLASRTALRKNLTPASCINAGSSLLSAMLVTLQNGLKPQVDPTAWIAETAAVIGDVRIGKKSTIWFNAVLRGDVFPIIVGDETNIQDLTMVHGTYKKAGTTIGNRVTIGHQVTLHGTTIGDLSLIGMGSVLMDLSKIAPRCVVGAGSLVTENSVFEEEGWLIMGRPAKMKRKLTEVELKFLDQSADNYMLYRTWYK